MKRLNNYLQIKLLAWFTVTLLAALVVGCGGGGGSTASGTLGVSLTDAPACGFDAVNVTVIKVRAHQSSSATDTDAGWTDITLNPARKIDLLSLTNGVLTSLGETPLAAGHYTQLRLVLDPNTALGLTNSVTPTGRVETPLVTPSAVQSGIKLINQFDVASGQRVDLLLDFDACKSIVKRGNGTYALKPVIKVIPFVTNGIDGFVDQALLGSNVIVTAQQNGVIAQSTAPNATTGEFFLAHLVPGNYDVVLTADGRATAVIAAVPVATSTSMVNVSNNSNPITLPASTTRRISGTVTLNPLNSTVVAYAAAQQAVDTLPVTVKEVAADDSAFGAYSLTLPIGPPQFVQYSATLPLVFADGVFTVGEYTDKASATGYTTQSIVENISTLNVVRSFTLIP